MHQNFGDLWHLLQDGILHIMGNVVSLPHRERALDDDMQINVIVKADFTDMAFLKAKYSRNG